MASSATLKDISGDLDPKQKAEKYEEYLDTVVALGDMVQCKEFADHVLSESVPLVLSRQLLGKFVDVLNKLDADLQMEMAEYLLSLIQPRAVSYEEQAAALRERLASVCEAREEWGRAARTLAGIDLDSGMRTLNPEYKLAKNIKISMLYLEDDDPINAETYIKKASALLGSVKDAELELQYKSCYARILDSKRRFLEAATRYYDISQAGNYVMDSHTLQAEELEFALLAATTCAILASAGAQRSRMLATLYKDERTAKLSVFPLLEKVYFERLLDKEEVSRFAEGLAPHQIATLPDGSTVLERAVIEHNLEAASKLYRNIYLEDLALLLGTPVEKAEAAAARMVSENRLRASIDQAERLVVFKSATSGLHQWDDNIGGICRRADAVLEAVNANML